MTTKRAQHNTRMTCWVGSKTIRQSLDWTDNVNEDIISPTHEEVLVKYDDDTVDEVDLKNTSQKLEYLEGRVDSSGVSEGSTGVFYDIGHSLSEPVRKHPSAGEEVNP